MSGLDNLKSRLEYRGGANQQTRMQHSKLDSLKRALLYSYQAATAILHDGREFRCLINPDKLKNEYEDKIISIPFEDICLNADKVGKTSEGLQVIGMKPGDIFTWKETDTKWLVYLQRLEETAYFRAEIRKCQYTIDINGNLYYIYGKKLGEIDWQTKQNISWNNLNYSLQIYISKDETTLEYFKRFKIVEINGEPWEVQAVDDISSEGLIIVALKETYTNSIAEEIEKEKENIEEPELLDNSMPYIDGYTTVYPYDELVYTIQNAEGGVWSLSSSKGEITYQDAQKAMVTITTGKSGKLELKYSREGQSDIIKDIEIESL